VLAAVTVVAAGLCGEAAKEPDPKISTIFPVAGRPGDSFEAVIRGTDLEKARSVIFEGSGLRASLLGAESEAGTEVKVKIAVAPDTPAGRYQLRVVTANGVTNQIALDVLAGPLVEQSAVHGAVSEFPVTIMGRLNRPGDTDDYWLEIRDGVTLSFEAVSLTPAFDPAIALYEPSGSWFDSHRLNRIAFNDEPLSFPGLSRNALLVHKFSRSGKYCVKVSGFNGDGGPDHAYELNITSGVKPTPSLHPGLSAVFEERQFTRLLRPTRMRDLASRGGSGKTEQPLETFRAAKEGSAEIPVMTIPGVVEGRITLPGEVHVIRVRLEKAQDIVFEVETPEATLPRFNPVVRLLEPGGREIATDVYTKLNNNGLYMMKMIRAKTTLSIGAAGEYTLQIRDITTACAGQDFRYRVLVRQQVPHVGNVEIAPERVNLPAGGSKPLNVSIDREEGFRGYVTVDVEGLPAGVTARPAFENPEDKPPLPNGGRLERYTPREQRTTVMLIATPDAPQSDIPKRIRVVVRVVRDGSLVAPLAVKEIPLMVLPRTTS